MGDIFSLLPQLIQSTSIYFKLVSGRGILCPAGGLVGLTDFLASNFSGFLAKLAELVDAGKLKPLLDEQRFDLSQAGAAHARLTGGQAIGKVVIDVG